MPRPIPIPPEVAAALETIGRAGARAIRNGLLTGLGSILGDGDKVVQEASRRLRKAKSRIRDKLSEEDT